MNSYEILGVAEDAPLKMISERYRHLIKQNHPDKVASMAPEFRKLAEKRMKEINAAYAELKKRAA